MQIGFTAVASERPAPCVTHQVSAPVLWFAANRDFTPEDVLISVASITPQYSWMINSDANPQLTPTGAFAGDSTQVMPMLPFPSPFWVEENAVIRMQFQNSATDPVDEGLITFVGLKLTGPLQQKDGTWGWRGYTATQ